MMKVFWALLVCFLSVINNALADSASMTQAMNFGSVRLSNPQNSAIVVLDSDGTYGTQTNIATSSDQKNGIMRYQATDFAAIFGRQVTASTTGSGSLACSTPATCSGCSVSFDNMVVSPTSQSIGLFDNNKNFNYGGRITIPANCGYGSFSGSLNVSYSYRNGNVTGQLTINLVIDPQPVSVQSTQDLSFGTLLATATHDVVVNPDGTRQSSLYVVNDASYPYHNGIIQITKQESGSRSVTVAVDSQTSISNGGTSLLVDLVTSPVASSITTLTSKDTYINVGGTLHVTQGAPAGEYIGTYRIEVTY